MIRSANGPLLLRHARIVSRDGLLESTDVLIESGRIFRLLDSSTNGSSVGYSVVDLDGLILFPGFIDIHMHGAVGIDTMEASSDDLGRIAEFLSGKGVTGWLPTFVPSPHEQYERSVEAISDFVSRQDSDKSGIAKAQVLGLHYEGPFVNSEQCGALHREYFRTFKTVADLDALPTIKIGHAVHMMTLAPEIEGGIDLIKELERRGWVVSIGHTRAEVSTLDQAATAGARHMTHFMNAMTPLHHRAPGPVGWGLLNDGVTCDVIADGVHLDPSILKLIVRNKGMDRVCLISDAIAATGQGDGEYWIWGEKIIVKNNRTQNWHGTIAGSAITMLDAVRMMLSIGVSEWEVARLASANPARLLGVAKDYGTIEEGKRADLVALDQSNEVVLTLIGGRIAFQR